MAAIDVGGGERCILVKRPVLSKARVDLVRAERNQLCAAFLRCSRHPARQQNVGAVGLVRVLFAVARVGERRRVYDHVRLLAPHPVGHGLLICCGRHSFGEGAQLVSPRQLGHDACPHKAARAGDQ